MKVKDLIQALEKVDPNLEVYGSNELMGVPYSNVYALKKAIMPEGYDDVIFFEVGHDSKAADLAHKLLNSKPRRYLPSKTIYDEFYEESKA